MQSGLDPIVLSRGLDTVVRTYRARSLFPEKMALPLCEFLYMDYSMQEEVLKISAYGWAFYWILFSFSFCSFSSAFF